MKKEVIIIEADVKKANEGIGQVNRSLEETRDTTKEANKELSSTTENIDTLTGGSASKFAAMKGSVIKVAKSFKSLRVAIAATGIGALLLAILAVKRAFTDSEEGQNKYAKLMAKIGVVTGNILDLVADLGEKIISLFENPKQSLKDFSKLLKENITNRFEGLVELVPQLGKAISLLFKGEFSEAGKVATNAVAKVTLGVENIVDKTQEAIEKTKEFTKSFAEQNKAEVELAGQVADARAKADKIERALIVRRAELENKIAQLRLKSREEDKFSAAERKQALLDAQVLEDELLVKEKEVLKLRSDAITLENTFSRSNKENLREEAEAKAALLRQEAARTNQQRQTQRELNRLNKEISAEENRILKEKQKAEADALAAKKKADDEETARLKKQSEERIRIEKEEAQAKIVAREKLFNDLQTIAGAETKLGKAVLIAKQLLAAKELAIEIGKTISFSTQAAARSTVAVAEGTAQTAKIGFPQNIPMLIGYAAQAVGIIGAIKSATSKAKAPISLPSSSTTASTVTSAAPRTPSFNVVGQGGTNQLAEAIGSQTQQPVKAYVVSNDVSTAQELDRNIIESASI